MATILERGQSMSGDWHRLFHGSVLEAITAALALRRGGLDDARLRRLAAASRHADPTSKLLVLHALARGSDGRARRLLLDALLGTDAGRRSHAAWVLGEHSHDPRAIARLTGLAARAASRRCRRAHVRALAASAAPLFPPPFRSDVRPDCASPTSISRAAWTPSCAERVLASADRARTYELTTRSRPCLRLEVVTSPCFRSFAPASTPAISDPARHADRAPATRPRQSPHRRPSSGPTDTTSKPRSPARSLATSRSLAHFFPRLHLPARGVSHCVPSSSRSRSIHFLRRAMPVAHRETFPAADLEQRYVFRACSSIGCCARPTRWRCSRDLASAGAACTPARRSTPSARSAWTIPRIAVDTAAQRPVALDAPAIRRSACDQVAARAPARLPMLLTVARLDRVKASPARRGLGACLEMLETSIDRRRRPREPDARER